MRLPKIDKEIIEKYSQGYELKFYAKVKGKGVRMYMSNDKNYTLTISNRTEAQYLIDFNIRLMIVRRELFKIVITRYKDQIVVLMGEKTPFHIELEKPLVNIDKEYVDDYEYDNSDYKEELPYAYTNGRWSPCPYCGSEKISTFWDGTAQCDDCKREFRYMY